LAHVELSLWPNVNSGSLELWGFVVSMAAEPCVVLDHAGMVVAASPGCRQLLGIEPAESVGLRLVDEVLRLLDFNAVSAGELRGWEVDVIPPLLAIKSGGLARGLVRVSGGTGATRTVDAVSTPLKQQGEVVGSLTFFNAVP
jgi:PAS domain-containing protein